MEDLDTEVLVGNEVESTEMDLMLGVTDLNIHNLWLLVLAFSL